ncbi:serine racemase [Aureococcus anophagefferens]|nr:serine racemase [Aureococcus anophagefferens]
MSRASKIAGLKTALTTVSPQSIRAAAERIAPYAVRTPVLRSDRIDALAGCEVHFKCEHLQVTGSFKARGALNAVLSLSDAEAAVGVVAHSTGNHGAAVARAAQARGAPCAIVVPTVTPAAKLANIARYGPAVVQCEPSPAARRAASEAEAARLGGATIVHPFDDGRVICGQGTIGLELLEDVAGLDAILVPVSGGGMLGGVAAARAGTPTRHRRGARGQGAGAALAAGERVIFDEAELEARPTLATAALRLTASELKQAVEPAGAVALAGLLSRAFAALRDDPERPLRRVAAVVCGGNVDAGTLAAILAGGGD